MSRGERSILCNAEPFGFGPAAAVAAIAPLLAKTGIHIGYIGEGHTLDLQHDIPYQEVVDLSGRSAGQRAAVMRQISSRYSVFMTAMDFTMARSAKAAGMRTAVYDALAWYWPTLAEVRDADFYAAQDFFGVRQRLQAAQKQLPPYVIVPPIVQRQQRQAGDSVLLNVGGLQNPLWSESETLAYARLMIDSVRKLVDPAELVVTANAHLAAALGDRAVQTLSWPAMERLLGRSHYAFMTPGLGNIYDAAAYNLPTVWLPPANDSQGRQRALLLANKCQDAAVDWADVGRPLDYAASQPGVLRALSRVVGETAGSVAMKGRLHVALAAAHKVVRERTNSRSAHLLSMFGTGGAEAVARQLARFVEEQI